MSPRRQVGIRYAPKSVRSQCRASRNSFAAGVFYFAMIAQMRRPLNALKRIGRWAGPIAVLLLLMAGGIPWHRIAMVQLGMTGDLSARMTPAAAGRIHLVNYISNHPWFVLPYLAAFIGGVLWTQFRQLPRWSLWVAFWLLALPVFGYMWICYRISTAGFFFGPD
jgi:hypothetical protein